jgi:protein-disulfide isomerase
MPDEQNFLIVKKNWYRKPWGVALLVFLILLALALIWFAFVFLNAVVEIYNKKLSTQVSTEKMTTYEMASLLETDDPYLGKKSAAVQIIEFGDFNCAICKNSYTVIRELAAKYPDDVIIYWKNYPVISLDSVDLAVAGECANEQDKFWPLHDKMFQMQGSVTADNLSTLAKQVGLDVEAFDFCLQKQNIRYKVQFDYDAAQKIKASGTPTFIINGYKIEGYVPMEIWEQLIEVK